MMRPMKLGGEQLLFGRGCISHLANLSGTRAVIVTGGSSMSKSGVLSHVQDLLSKAGMAAEVFSGVESDPSFSTVLRGSELMKSFQPDWIVGLGGGSAMDAAKAMWIFYEHPELKSLQDILPPSPFPHLRTKARLICIPSTAGTGSEVSRSIVITDEKTGLKIGIGNMEMVPDVALCDPEITISLPPKITAETGMDALTHSIEALVSRRANYVSNILATAAARDIIFTLPHAYQHGDDIDARETMLNASMVAGLAFTNVSLGIVHAIAHTLGGYFKIAHGLADAIILPYIIRFNSSESSAAAIYNSFSASCGITDLASTIESLNNALSIPRAISALIPDRSVYESKVEEMARIALQDGVTKTNPIIPDEATMRMLLLEVYNGTGNAK
jgi:alcohol dehydrogenase class IV